MKQFPSVPRAEDAPPELFESGHLWIQEQVDGAHLRFRLRESGLLEFGSEDRVYHDADEIPDPYHHAVRHVREQFDREALRTARDDVESVVFFGVSTHRRAIDYDWDRIPSFLGFDVWSEAEEQFLPPDAVEQVYDQLGLDAVNTFQKEVRATDFDPDGYEIPDSNWYDGPAAGVVLRSKTGQRAQVRHPSFPDEAKTSPANAPADPAESSAEELARELVTRHRVETVVRRLEARGRSVGFDAVYERVVEDVIREEYGRLFDGEEAETAEWVVDVGAFRSEAAARTQEFLDE